MTDDTEKIWLPGSGRMLAGCAGWSIPGADRGAFPAEGSHLEKYASVFGAVEVNSSFYRPHQAKTYEKWAGCVPNDFRFSVKLPRTITHDAKLVDVGSPLEQFAGEVAGLGEKLGCVLVQLPPKLEFDAQLAAEFIGRLTERLRCTIALEARNASWFSGEATALLTGAEVTRVIADPPKGQEGPHVPTTATIYVRLHGSPRVYYSSYEAGYLAQLAQDMRVHALAGRTVWTIFDNTASGASMSNALAVVRDAPAKRARAAAVAA